MASECLGYRVPDLLLKDFKVYNHPEVRWVISGIYIYIYIYEGSFKDLFLYVSGVDATAQPVNNWAPGGGGLAPFSFLKRA